MGSKLSGIIKNASKDGNSFKKDKDIDEKHCILSLISFIESPNFSEEIQQKIDLLLSKNIYILYLLENENLPLAEDMITKGYDQNAAMITLKTAETLFERKGMLEIIKKIEHGFPTSNPGRAIDLDDSRKYIANAFEKCIDIMSIIDIFDKCGRHK